MFPFTLALSVCYKGLGLAHLHLTRQMQCSHLVEFSISQRRTSALIFIVFYSISVFFGFLQYFVFYFRFLAQRITVRFSFFRFST